MSLNKSMFLNFCLVLVLLFNYGESKGDISYNYSNEKINTSYFNKLDDFKEKINISLAIISVYKNTNYTDISNVVNSVYKYSKHYNINPKLVLGLIASESEFKKNIVSAHGAIGYMQVMPKYHQDKLKGRSLLDLNTNIQVGIKILSDCFRKFSSIDKALGCYNGTKNPEKILKYKTKVYKRKFQILELAQL